MGKLIALVATTMVAASCAGLPADSAPTTTSNTTVGTVVTTSTTSPDIGVASLGCQANPEMYEADGPLGIVGSDDGDAQLIAGLRLVSSGDCERFEVSLSTDGGAPATRLPVAEVELIAASGVIRISFAPSVTRSAVTDSIFEGSLIERAYVVRGLDGSIFVDAHLSRAVAARTFVRQNPARVAIEVQPIDTAAATFPKVGGLVVVTGPTAGSVEYPIIVTGYSRTFEANVIARLFSDTGIETEVFTTAADYLELWGEFVLAIGDGPGGDVTIFVGEESAEDGTPVGIEFIVSVG